MTLAQYVRGAVRVAHERRRTIAAFAALGALSCLALGWSRPPSFEATAQLFVSPTTAATPGTESASWLAQRVRTYAGLASSQEVLTSAAAQLQLRLSPDQLEPMVAARAVPDTVLLDVTVTDQSPSRARDLANAIADQLPAMVARLEKPSPTATPSVSLVLTRPAVEPRSPVSIGRAASVLAGLLAGLGLGLVVAAVRGALDATVRTGAQAVRAAGVAVLAEIEDDPDAGHQPLITNDPFAARAEAFRRLRTNLRLRPGLPRARSILVTSAVGGEGRTATACNLAITLAQNGENVVLVDADLRSPGVSDLLGLTGHAGLTSVLTAEVGIMQALQSWRADLPLRVLPAGPLPPNPSELLGSPRMAALVNALADSGVTVVLDAPPALTVTDAVVLARVTDGVVAVCRARCTSAEDLGAATEAVRAAGGTVLGVVLNRTSRRATAPGGLATGYRLAVDGWPAGARSGPAERATPGDTLAAGVWATTPAALPFITPAASGQVDAPPPPLRPAVAMMPAPIQAVPRQHSASDSSSVPAPATPARSVDVYNLPARPGTYGPTGYPATANAARPPGVERRQGRRRLQTPLDAPVDVPAQVPVDAVPPGWWPPRVDPPVEHLVDPGWIAAAHTDPYGHRRAPRVPAPDQGWPPVAEPVWQPEPVQAIDVRDVVHGQQQAGPAWPAAVRSPTSVWAPPVGAAVPADSSRPETGQPRSTFEAARAAALPARRHRH